MKKKFLACMLIMMLTITGCSSKSITQTLFVEKNNKYALCTLEGDLKTKFKYVGKNAVVILNKTGKVITTWAKHKVGRRIGGILLWLGLNSLYEN